MPRDQLLGRARRAVLAIAGTANGLGGRAKRRQADEPTPTGRAATPGLPPRIDHERTPGMPAAASGPVPLLPPRIDREPTAELPPRIERAPMSDPQPRPRLEHPPALAPQPELPPRIEHWPEPPAAPPLPPAVPAITPPADPPAHEPSATIGAWPPAPQPHHAGMEEAPPGPDPEVAAEAGVATERQQPRPTAVVRPRQDPLGSPVRTVLRSHQRLAYIVLAVIIVAAAGYWALRVHQRIGERALEAGITNQQHAPTVRCAALQSNGSAWACAVVYQAESVCLLARVNVLGSWSTTIAQHRCQRIPQLAELAPRTITATMVEADIRRRQGHPDFVCNKLPSHKVRWACERPIATGGQCLVVRVIQWTSWNVLDGGRTCVHDPGLQRALRHASAGT